MLINKIKYTQSLIFSILTLITVLNASQASASGSRSSSASFSGSRSSSSSMGGGSSSGSSTNNQLTMSGPESKASAYGNLATLNTALNRMGADSMAGKKVSPVPNKPDPLYCLGNSGAIEGEMQQIKDEQRKQCVEQFKQKQALANKILNTNVKKEDCVQKINFKSVYCQARRVLDNIVTTSKIQLKIYGNVVRLDYANVPILMTIIESLDYNITEVPVHHEAALKDPNVAIEFNVLGSVLCQKGDLPKKKQKGVSDACKDCIESLKKQTSSVDGMKTECESECPEDEMGPSFDHFTKTTKDPSAPNQATKPAPAAA